MRHWKLFNAREMWKNLEEFKDTIKSAHDTHLAHSHTSKASALKDTLPLILGWFFIRTHQKKNHFFFRWIIKRWKFCGEGEGCVLGVEEKDHFSFEGKKKFSSAFCCCVREFCDWIREEKVNQRLRWKFDYFEGEKLWKIKFKKLKGVKLKSF